MGIGIAVFGYTQNKSLVEASQQALITQVSRQALMGVDRQSTIICFGDLSCFSLIYLQKIDGLRPDVTIIPVAPQLNKDEADKFLAGLGFVFPDNPFRLMEAMALTNAAQRPVYLAEVPDIYKTLFGLNGEAFNLEAWPMGYKVGCGPSRNIENPDETSLQKRSVDRRDTYLNLFKAYRQSLGTKPTSTPCLDSEDHYKLALNCRTQNDMACSFKQTIYAILKDPKPPRYWLTLAQVYEGQGYVDLAKREYRHVLVLEAQNATASAALIRLKQVKDLDE